MSEQMAAPLPEPRLVEVCTNCNTPKYEYRDVAYRSVGWPQQCNTPECSQVIGDCCIGEGTAFECDAIGCNRKLCGKHIVNISGDHFCEECAAKEFAKDLEAHRSRVRCSWELPRVSHVEIPRRLSMLPGNRPEGDAA
jgi:hypothetical protein